ncbi:hypothetical protein BKA93DRAFT_750757 [Sparassis latifolia]
MTARRWSAIQGIICRLPSIHPLFNPHSDLTYVPHSPELQKCVLDDMLGLGELTNEEDERCHRGEGTTKKKLRKNLCHEIEKMAIRSLLTTASDIIKSEKVFAAHCNVIKEQECLSVRINEVICILDPGFHKILLELCEASSKVAFVDAMNLIDPLLLEGWEFLFNRKSGQHLDMKDPSLE